MSMRSTQPPSWANLTLSAQPEAVRLMSNKLRRSDRIAHSETGNQEACEGSAAKPNVETSFLGLESRHDQRHDRAFATLWVLILVLSLVVPLAAYAHETAPTAQQASADTPRGEPYRPQYDLTSPEKWMGAPCGLVYSDGQYHLFYVHDPVEKVPSLGFWGHAVTTDLVNWQHQPIALYPDVFGSVEPSSVVLDEDDTAGFGSGAMVALFSQQREKGEPLALDDGVLKLHIFVDQSMLEAYANGRKSITTRIYPTRPDATGLQVWADGSVTVKSMDVWRLTSAYGETVPAYYPEQEPVPDHGVPPNHSFQSCRLTGWIDVESKAFTDDHGTGAEDWGWGGAFRQAEDGTNSCHLWGVHDLHDGDDGEGLLRLQTFTLSGGGQIDFLISGGRRPEELYVALVRASDGESLVRATGHDSEQYRRVRWDASKHLGEELYVEIVDQASGGWGHLNLDDINVPTEETFEEVAVATTATPEPEASQEEVKPTATEEVAATDQLVDEERAEGSSAPTRWLPILLAVVAAVVAIVVAVILLRRRHRP